MTLDSRAPMPKVRRHSRPVNIESYCENYLGRWKPQQPHAGISVYVEGSRTEQTTISAALKQFRKQKVHIYHLLSPD
jgi:hypothetical protein